MPMNRIAWLWLATVLLCAAGSAAEPPAAQPSTNTAPYLVRPIPNLTIDADAPFKYLLCPTGAVYFGYDLGGNDITVTDNYFASHVSVYQPWQDIVLTGNTFVSHASRLLFLRLEPSARVQWDNNRYVCSLAQPFFCPQPRTWDQWRTFTGFDAHSSLVPTATETAVFVRPNQYEPGRGHVVVYNWKRLDTIEVDLSSVVRPGAAYRIYHVLDLKGEPVVNGVFDGKSVSLPLKAVPFPMPVGYRPPAELVLDREFATFLVLSDAPPALSTGKSFYVAPDGAAHGDGSLQHPWSLRTAMEHPAGIHPGDTIWVRGGTYKGGFMSRLSGTPEAPIHVRAAPGEEVRIDVYDETQRKGTLISLAGQHTWYQGFEVLSTDPASRVTREAGSWPEAVQRGNFNVVGDHIKIINFQIHDLNSGIGFWAAGTGGELYGSIIYNNGWIGPDRNHGHAVYTQNEGTTRRLIDNIAFHQFRNGIVVYGSSEGVLKDYYLEGNISFANGGAVGEGYNGAFQLLVGGGTLAERITVTGNFTYDLPAHFRDGDAGDMLTFSAVCDDGRPLPAWLTFVENEGFFYGTPTEDDVGTIPIRVTARDTAGAVATDVFQLTVSLAQNPARSGNRQDRASSSSARSNAVSGD